MVTGKTVKFFASTNNNAPQLANVSGSMIALLDACLVSGIQVGSITSLAANGNLATATFGVAHNLMKYQVIRISGANQAEFNGDFKITQVVNSNTVTFTLNSSATVSTASGTINCMLTPLGWTKAFSSTTTLGGGRAAYRPSDTSLPNRPYLRVIDEKISTYSDTYAKYAKVGIVENMTDINTMTGVQAPYISSATTRNWNPTGSGTSMKNGWARWYYCTLGDYTTDSQSLSSTVPVVGNWFVVGTDSGFYLVNSYTNDPTALTTDLQRGFCYGFGNFTPIADDDLFVYFLSATNIWDTVSTITSRAEQWTYDIIKGSENPDLTAATHSLFLQRGYKKSAYAQATCRKCSIESNFIVSGNGTDQGAGADAIGGVILQTPLIIELLDTTKLAPRGFLPLIKTIPHQASYTDLQLVEQNGHAYIAKYVHGSSAIPQGIVMFDLGEL